MPSVELRVEIKVDGRDVGGFPVVRRYEVAAVAPRELVLDEAGGSSDFVYVGPANTNVVNPRIIAGAFDREAMLTYGAVDLYQLNPAGIFVLADIEDLPNGSIVSTVKASNLASVTQGVQLFSAG